MKNKASLQVRLFFNGLRTWARHVIFANCSNYQKGFHLVPIVLAIAAVGLIGFAGYKVFKNQDTKQANNTEILTPSPDEALQSDVRWENTSEGGWMAMNGAPPTCPSPFSLSDPSPQLRQATSILYPGQERTGEVFGGQGGNYKPHGGFRFDKTTKPEDVNVLSPINGYVYRGGQYLSGGELQYTFDVIHPCGYMVRVGHLKALSDTFQQYASKFPAAQEGDSRTERVEGFPVVKEGDVIATAVGYSKGPNIFFDLGVFDLRRTNIASKDPAYQAKYASAKEHFYYGVCWFDMLSKSSSDFVKSLPAADPAAGKKSDYCK